MDVESKKKVFINAMKGRWREVIRMYQENERLHEARITRSGDTALHIAVSKGREDVVEYMVSIMSTSALQIQNERNNTALHLAASMGNEKMCLLIANKHPHLVDIRNIDGETPLFSAALHVRKQAFLCLHFIRNPNTTTTTSSSPYYANCRRNNGDTILHSAIAGGHFDLAFQIINLYGQLVNWVNEEGLSPLHLLAAKPSIFRSGSSLGLFQMIIYHCILVKELQVAQLDQDKFPRPSNAKPIQQGRPQLPHNYKTCWHLFNVIKTALPVVTKKFPIRRGDHGQSSNGADVEVGGDHTCDARSKARARRHLLYPPNYKACCNFFKFVYVAVMAILGKGGKELRKIQQKKEQHTWSVQIMNELLCRAALYEYDDDGSIPLASHIPFQEETGSAPYCIDLAGNISMTPTAPLKNQSQDSKKKKKIETPILIAAKNGIIEMVEKILEVFPVAIHDENKEEKNIVLLAAENRQPHVYQLLLKRNLFIESIFRQVDDERNSALHLAAKLGNNKPWLIPALQLQWEVKWFEFVLYSMPPQFFVRHNKDNKTPIELFDETHKDLVQSGSDWLNNTSQSCSVVAALIATVAFATTAAVPGGVQEKTGHPTLEGETAFTVYAVSSLISVFGSVISVLMFLSLLTSRHQRQDFRMKLPMKLILALTSMIVSLASMLVSFCTAHFFMVQDRLPNVALPLYFVASLPLIFFAFDYLPLYCDFWRATLTKAPRR